VGKGTSQKPLKREFSAGGVVFKKDSGKILWLVTKSAPSERIQNPVWRLPKGWIDNASADTPGEVASGLRKGKEDEIQKGALREVEEEGGVGGRIVEKLGTVKFFFQLQGEKILKFVTYYLMEWVRDLPEGPGFETETVEWLSFEEAYKRLKFPSEKDILKKANGALERGIQQNLV
jgi:8-oxo-dGTP pyrophosphatase MutT (NUDIX family)